MDYFHDRRGSATPSDDDFSVPLDRRTVAEANARLRAATTPYNLGPMDDRITSTAKQRHRARLTGRGDFESVGHYLAHMADG